MTTRWIGTYRKPPESPPSIHRPSTAHTHPCTVYMPPYGQYRALFFESAPHACHIEVPTADGRYAVAHLSAKDARELGVELLSRYVRVEATVRP